MATCEHSWCHAGGTLVIDTVIEDWLGPTIALVRCDKCDQPALTHLLAWSGQQLTSRIFGVREIPGDIVNTYLANISRDYCDLTRKQSETESLFQAANVVHYIILTKTPGMLIVNSQSADKVKLNAKIYPWQEIDHQDYNDQYEKWLTAITETG